MKRKISDKRVNDISEKEVMVYPREEKETILSFDYQEQVWKVWTSVPEHITKLLKLKNNNLEVDSVTETGTITSIKGNLNPKQVSFRNNIEMTEERKKEIKNRFKRK